MRPSGSLERADAERKPAETKPGHRLKIPFILFSSLQDRCPQTEAKYAVWPDEVEEEPPPETPPPATGADLPVGCAFGQATTGGVNLWLFSLLLGVGARRTRRRS